MRAITKALGGKKYETSILLSPGTPAMAAVWVLLGKTKYPARFYQTHENKTWITDIPFDLTVDFVPELLRGADSVFQHLASRSPQDIQGFERIVGDSTAIRLAVGRARKAALRDVPVLLSGDTLFPGGPGATKFEGGDFATIIRSIDDRLFAKLDPDTIILPGHGDQSTIGAERPHLQEWVDRGW